MPKPLQVEAAAAASTRRWALDGSACLLTSLALKGEDKYLGACVGEDGCVYGIPGTAREVLRIDPSREDEATLMGDTRGDFVSNALQRKRLKWLRGVAQGDAIYGIPANADKVLEVRRESVRCVGEAVSVGTRWKYHGAVATRCGKIVCIPACAERVLLVDAGGVREIGPRLQGAAKWYGGLLGDDGRVYGVPFNADRVLRVDPATERVSLMGPSLGAGGYKWHGGVRVAKGSVVIGVPSHAATVLKIVPSTGVVTTIGLVEPGPVFEPDRRRYRSRGRYQYGGGVALGSVVFCFPYDAHLPLRIDTATNRVETVPASAESAGDFRRHNKWQNGFVSPADGRVYAIPVSARGVLRIDPATNVASTVARDLCVFADEQWEGGCVEPASGALYAVPQGAPFALKIDPASAAYEDVETYPDGVVVRLLAAPNGRGDHARRSARLALSLWLAVEATRLRSKRLLELGCGSGSCAALAAKLGLDLVATDADEACLEITARNVSRNTSSGPVPRTRRLRWGLDAVEPNYDLVFGADVAYSDSSDLGALFLTARAALRCRGPFVVAFLRSRPCLAAAAFFQAAHDARASALVRDADLPRLASGAFVFSFFFDDDRPEPRLGPSDPSSPLHDAVATAFPNLWTKPTAGHVDDESPFGSEVPLD